MALVVAGASYVRGRVAHGVLHLAAARRARRRTARETLVERQAEAPLHDDAHRPRRHPELGPHGDGVEHVARVRLARRDEAHGLALRHARAHQLVPEAEPRCMMHDLGEATLSVL